MLCLYQAPYSYQFSELYSNSRNNFPTFVSTSKEYGRFCYSVLVFVFLVFVFVLFFCVSCFLVFGFVCRVLNQILIRKQTTLSPPASFPCHLRFDSVSN